MEDVKPIEVVIDLNEMKKIPGSGNQERWLNDQLRKAGIPVKGVFSFEGVTLGNLRTDVDMVTNKFTLTWSPD